MVLRILTKSEIKRTTFGRLHEVREEKEETTAGDGSSVNVITLSVCRDVASIRLLRTSLCRNDKEGGHLCLGNPVCSTRRRRGRILVVVDVARCDSLRCRRFGEQGGWPSIVRSGDCQSTYRKRVI